MIHVNIEYDDARSVLLLEQLHMSGEPRQTHMCSYTRITNVTEISGNIGTICTKWPCNFASAISLAVLQFAILHF